MEHSARAWLLNTAITMRMASINMKILAEFARLVRSSRAKEMAREAAEMEQTAAYLERIATTGKAQNGEKTR